MKQHTRSLTTPNVDVAIHTYAHRSPVVRITYGPEDSRNRLFDLGMAVGVRDLVYELTALIDPEAVTNGTAETYSE